MTHYSIVYVDVYIDVSNKEHETDITPLLDKVMSHNQ